jgi:hypothetical protein
VVSLGAITAGVIDIMYDVVTRGTSALNELDEGLLKIFVGGGIAVMGRLVFDIIRERVGENELSNEEKLTIDE